MKKNILLSFPRCGNHLCRFFIELLSEIPTYGCNGGSQGDIEIYRNIFPEKVPFNIQKTFNKKDCYYKSHLPPKANSVNKLILILRNPREVYSREKNKNSLTENYFKNIDFYNNHTGEKLLLYYEDMMTNKIEFIETLYKFLDVENIEKKKYAIDNVDKLYELSSKGKNRLWGGYNSKGNINCYYKRISGSDKKKLDAFLESRFEKYSFLKEKYIL